MGRVGIDGVGVEGVGVDGVGVEGVGIDGVGVWVVGACCCVVARCRVRLCRWLPPLLIWLWCGKGGKKWHFGGKWGICIAEKGVTPF